MDFFEKLRHRAPSQIDGNLGPNVQIDSGNEEITAWPNESGNITKTAFRIRGSHVAKKTIGDDNVLEPEATWELGVGGICETPIYALAEPRLDPEKAVAFLVEHRFQFGFS